MSDGILEQLQQADSEVQTTWIITDTLLQTLPPALRTATLAAAVPHWFNATVLAALLQLETDQAVDLEQEIQALAFSEPFGTLGYALHDLTRRAILYHLTTSYPELFQSYSQRAYNYFSTMEDDQHQVEAIYHLLADDQTAGIDAFKERMRNYRRQNKFSAANNLIRNAEELDELNLLSNKSVAEIERQNYLMGWKYVQLGKKERIADKAYEHLSQAINIFNPAEDVEPYQHFDPE
ncbi:MAG: hypothetical protein KDJ52_32545, partial [Anaerolineae bacterium]|nr:hypothetical protein [Anaerolineae bacterium]